MYRYINITNIYLTVKKDRIRYFILLEVDWFECHIYIKASYQLLTYTNSVILYNFNAYTNRIY